MPADGSANLIHFKPGQSGNPGGRPTASRNIINDKFLRALSKSFDEHGEAAIEHVATQDPVAYVRILATLVPRDQDTKDKLDELTDEQLETFIGTVRAVLAGKCDISKLAANIKT